MAEEVKIDEAKTKAKTVQKSVIEAVKSEDEIIRERAFEKVSHRLHKDGENYKDDVPVSVNFEMIQIKRGVEVKIPRCYKEVLENSEQCDLMAAKRLEELEDAYNNQK